MSDSNVPAFPPRQLALPPEALSGVRTRRVFAWMVDAVIVTGLTWLAGLVMVLLALPTIGFSFAAAPLLAFVGVFYAGLTMSGRGMSTWGQRMLGLMASTRSGERLDFITAAAHALIFWLTAPVFFAPALIAFFNEEKRTLHDYLTGVIFTRRP